MAYGQKLVINAQTGEQTFVDLTAEEIAQRDADRAAAQAREDMAAQEKAALEVELAAALTKIDTTKVDTQPVDVKTLDELAAVVNALAARVDYLFKVLGQ